MTFDTQMTLALLQELLLALRANDPDDFKAWLSLGIERLGKPAVVELMVNWIDPILTTDEARTQKPPPLSRAGRIPSADRCPSRLDPEPPTSVATPHG